MLYGFSLFGVWAENRWCWSTSVEDTTFRFNLNGIGKYPIDTIFAISAVTDPENVEI